MNDDEKTCQWCGEKAGKFTYVLVGVGEFEICSNCMNLAGNQEWDALTEKVDKFRELK